MPIDSAAFAAFSATEPLKPWNYQIRDPLDDEIIIEVHYCGLCHSDIHTVRDEWAEVPNNYPIVVGHEFVGVVSKVGSKVSKWKVGDKAGVGCYVDTCRNCDRCANPLTVHYCDKCTPTYSGIGRDGQPTRGGYGRFVVTQETCAAKIPDNLPMERVAPLLCAGITMWSPIMHLKLDRQNHPEMGSPKLKIGVVGLGGLGHMALQFAAKVNPDNEVYVFSRTSGKKELAMQLGAKDMIISPEDYAKHMASFDYILDTVSACKDMAPYVNCLKLDGTMCIVGVPPSNNQPTIPVMPMIMRRRKLMGSTIGSYKEAQDMIDFCAAKNILPITELIPCNYVNEAYERVLKSDVQFRFVFDVKNTHA